MDSSSSLPTEIFWQEDSFQFIKPEEFDAFGIDPADIPVGTFAALTHPSHLPSRFGGNAYGFGLFEVHDRLKSKDIKLIQSISFENPEDIRRHYKDLNEIYRKIGLLIRFSQLGTRYYLIPAHFISNTLTNIRARVDEISKIVSFHRKKYLKERYEIGIFSLQDDLILHQLSLRFKEHRFVAIDSLEKLQSLHQTLDLFVVPKDLYEIILMENFSPLSKERFSKKRLDQYAMHILWKLYNVLKPDGEIFIIADRHTPKTNQTIEVTFKTTKEEKNFLLFSHIFKTRKKYRSKSHSLQVTVFDFQKYLSSLYVEHEVVEKLLGGKSLEKMTLGDLHKLPYLNFPLADPPFMGDQEKTWSKFLSVYFDELFLKPLVHESVKEDWEKRFSCTDYAPNYMVIYLGQKQAPKAKISDLTQDVLKSRLLGCPPDYVAEYRNSFDYVIRTLRVIELLKKGEYKDLPQLVIDRLREPLENEKRRFSALNHVIKLTTKTGRLKKLAQYLNPDRIEGPRTKILENLEALTFFGFNYDELKEIFYIVLGHTAMGLIISGKMNQKALKPVSDLARTYDPLQASNLLRYCRLMTMAETEASKRSPLTLQQLAELFDLYESALRVVINPDLDWDTLLDEKTTSMGGIHNRIVRKLLMMTNHFDFLDNWAELRQKGQMGKESLADYDDRKLSRIENVITLVNTIEQFEEMYLKFDPLQLPVFYRKFLDIEFHGTLQLFERMDSQRAFILLWISVNVARGDIINFNSILANVETAEIDELVKKIEQETKAINTRYLDLAILRQFSERIHQDQDRSSFIVGTGFQLSANPKTKALELAYMDIDKDIEQLESLAKKFARYHIPRIPVEDLETLEDLFSSLESFYHSHLSLITEIDPELKLPQRQKRWFQKVQELREYLRANFLSVIFRPEDVYANLDLLYHHAPSILNFILPEFTALQDLDLSGHLYLNSPVTHYIITAAMKLQALIRHDRESFQDTQFLHRLAQREFGPMATGIVGVSESQIEELEKIVEGLNRRQPLFDALVKSFIFQDIGRVPVLREKYQQDVNQADIAHTGALFLQKDEISKRYHINEKEEAHLVFLVRNHSLLHHILRGEFSVYALQGIIDPQDKELCDALFVLSFIMLSAIREDLLLEDLAGRVFQIRAFCHRVIDSETTLDAELSELFAQKGKLFYALETYKMSGLPEGLTPSDYLESRLQEDLDLSKCIKAGKMLFALERLFRLHGIRYAEFLDIVNLILKIPLKFIYKKRKFASIGYATFEKEVFEALRVYNTLQGLAEDTRHFILNQLADDKVRIFGYEKVSGYLSYKNQVKLLLIPLLAGKKFKANGPYICLNFLGMIGTIEKRYEAVNDCLNALPIEDIWGNKHQLNHFFKATTGLILKKEQFPNVLSIDFKDPVNISKKISYMGTIKNVEQLKNYFHYSLRSLRKHPFYTDDYDLELEETYEKRLTEITHMILTQTKKQMDLVKDFEELHNLVRDLLERSWSIGFSEEQEHRLNDLYEFRKDSLKREKLSEIDNTLRKISDTHELRDYWDSIKWYLQSNRQFFGTEFETLIAERFDEARDRIARTC